LVRAGGRKKALVKVIITEIDRKGKVTLLRRPSEGREKFLSVQEGGKGDQRKRGRIPRRNVLGEERPELGEKRRRPGLRRGARDIRGFCSSKGRRKRDPGSRGRPGSYRKKGGRSPRRDRSFPQSRRKNLLRRKKGIGKTKGVAFSLVGQGSYP